VQRGNALGGSTCLEVGVYGSEEGGKRGARLTEKLKKKKGSVGRERKGEKGLAASEPRGEKGRPRFSLSPDKKLVRRGEKSERLIWSKMWERVEGGAREKKHGHRRRCFFGTERLKRKKSEGSTGVEGGH